MSIDMEKIKSRLSSLTNPEGGGKSVFWRPQDGEQVIRIVPTADGDPFKDFFFHYNVGKNSGFLCPKKNFGDDCPVCSFVKTLFNDSDPDSIKMAKSLVARQRFFTPVVVRGEEAEGVRLWGFGKTAYQALLNLVLNPDYGDITDPVNGRDVVVEFISAEESGASFPTTKIRVKPNQTPISDDPTILEKVKSSQKDIRDIYQEQSYDDLTNVLNEWLNPGEDSSSESTPTQVTETATMENKKVKDTSEAFADLFNS